MARTLVRGSTQIMGESIFNDQIAEKDPGNGYNGIELDKIENSEHIVLSDGTATTGDIDMGSHKIVNVAPGTNANDVVIKSQLDSISAGLDPKESVRLATTGNITLSGNQSVDGKNTADGDRILVKNQTDPITNGIYITDGGSWTRSTDADGTTVVGGNTQSEISGGTFTFVESGTLNIGTGWVVVADGDINIDTDPVNWTQFAGGGAMTAGNGITISGTSISAKVDGTTITNTAGGDQIGVVSGGINTLQLANSAVTRDKIQDGEVTAVKVNSDIAGLGLSKNTHLDNKLDVEVDGTSIIISSGSLSIAAGGVGTTELEDGSVTPAKLDNTIAGDGIVSASGVLSVNVDDITIEIASDEVRVKALGINTAQLAADAVTKEKLNSDVAGIALAQATGGELDVQVDNSTITVNGSNQLEVDTSVMLAAADLITREKPVFTAAVDHFNLANTPVAGTEHVYVNGILMDDDGNDYTLGAGGLITFTFTLKWVSGNPEKSDKVLVTYFKA